MGPDGSVSGVSSALRTKNNKTHEVDCCPLALEILNEVSATGDLIFSTNNRTAPSGFSVAKNRLDKILPDLQPWRLLDIRRSATSGMSAPGILPIVVEQIFVVAEEAKSKVMKLISETKKKAASTRQIRMIEDQVLVNL